ncbi:hypothetical protein [Haloferula sp. BvORR071]|uniref:hypothetical protein n=1 Tax=Haloferula sp. BvORR071 TaxID=1396141 RepID=UPI002241035F|nr:hypothetical protein [Haloferula sp. BvORR071]
MLGDLTFPPDSVLEALYANKHDPDEIIYEEGDDDAPPPGKIRMDEWRRLQRMNARIGELLVAVPDGATGKSSAWYPKVQTWKAGFDQLLTTKAQADLFALLPFLLEFTGRNQEGEELSEELKDISSAMRSGMGSYFVNAFALHVSESTAKVSATRREQFIELFARAGWVSPTDWPEGTQMPVDGAGVMILDPAVAVVQLKAAGVEKAEWFIGGHKSSADFFEDYVGAGPGLGVLKARYESNKVLCDQKFKELLDWTKQE